MYTASTRPRAGRPDSTTLYGHLERAARRVVAAGVEALPDNTAHVYIAVRECGCIVGMRNTQVAGRDLGHLRDTLRAWRDAGLHVEVRPLEEAKTKWDPTCPHRQSDHMLDGLLALGEGVVV